MATQLSGLRDAHYRALQVGELLHLVDSVFPGPSCVTLSVTAQFLGGGKAGVWAESEGGGRREKLNRYSAGVHFPEDCPFQNIIALRRTA